MQKFILAVHFISCILLIITVLVQSGKGSAMGIFGGSGGDMLFPSSSGADFIKRFTIGLAATIAVTSLMLSVFAGRVGTGSVTGKYQSASMPSASVPMQSSAQPAQAPSSIPSSAQTPSAKK